MRILKLFYPLSICLGVSLTSASVHAGKLSVDISSLTASQQRVFAQVTQEEFCGCDSAMTLAGCLELRPDCKLAQNLAKVVRKGVEANTTAEEMLAYMSSSVMGPICAAPKTISVTGAPQKGVDTAPVTLIEFADFRCTHCRKAMPAVQQALSALGKSVKFIFIPFPLQPASMPAAEAAMAAHAQGKFWEMYTLLFQYEGYEYSAALLSEYAKKIGLNMKQFEDDLKKGKYRDKINAFRQAGMAAGVEGTPSFFVNGRRYEMDTVLFGLIDRLTLEVTRNQGKCQ